MLLYLSFGVINFCRTLENFRVDVDKYEVENKYPIIYLHECVRFKYIWRLFRTECVFENEAPSDNVEHDSEKKARAPWWNINDKMKIIGAIELEFCRKVEKKINIIWNDPRFTRKDNGCYWDTYAAHI
jgi:hypothetical protein